MSKYARMILAIIACMIAAVFALIFVYKVVEIQNARGRAKTMAKEAGVDTIDFECSEEIASKEQYLTEIWCLVRWEESTRETLNGVFGFSDDHYDRGEPESVSFNEEKSRLSYAAEKEKWWKLRRELDEEVADTIEIIEKKTGGQYEPDSSAIRKCYYNDGFRTIVYAMKDMEAGDGAEAFLTCGRSRKEEWGRVVSDIAYGLYPELFREGLEQAVLGVPDEEYYYKAHLIIGSAKTFSEMYGLPVPGLEKAEKAETRLEGYPETPAVPTVGMSLQQAKSTKIGAPTRTITGSGSWMGKKHYYGEMYWDKNGKQIFKAHYLDGKITDVSDTRNSTATRPSGRTTYSSGKSSSGKSSSGKSSSGKSSSGRSSSGGFDPEEHDIEGFYEDNRDEYDDYEDAYDAFLDDEDAWDDY